MKDSVGGADMTQGSLTTFAADRFGNPNAALNLNGGWTRVASGVYFNTPEFSISVWVYPINIISSSARIIDFGNGQNADNILFTIKNAYYAIFSGATYKIASSATQNVTLNQWQFLVLTFNGTHGNVYMNESLADSKVISLFTLSTLTRTNCYIGKSAWPNDGVSSSYLDDLRFYNVSLTHTEIAELMNQNQTGETACFLFLNKLNDSFIF
jgi:hypothetical protein